MPDPTMRTTVTSDKRSTRLTLSNFPELTKSGRTFEPALLVISSEHAAAEHGGPDIMVTAFSGTGLRDKAGHAIWDNYTCEPGSDDHLHALPELLRSIVLGHRPDLADAVRP